MKDYDPDESFNSFKQSSDYLGQLIQDSISDEETRYRMLISLNHLLNEFLRTQNALIRMLLKEKEDRDAEGIKIIY